MKNNNNLYQTQEGNLFPIGGLMPSNIPIVMASIGKKFRDRMYRTVRPESYSKEQVNNFIKGKQSEVNPKVWTD